MAVYSSYGTVGTTLFDTNKRCTSDGLWVRDVFILTFFISLYSMFKHHFCFPAQLV